jgi:hypothetical protein
VIQFTVVYQRNAWCFGPCRTSSKRLSRTSQARETKAFGFVWTGFWSPLDTLLYSVNGSRSVVVFAYAGFMLLFVIAATGRHMLVETIIAGRMLQAPERGQSHKVSNAVIRAHHAARILTLVA